MMKRRFQASRGEKTKRLQGRLALRKSLLWRLVQDRLVTANSHFIRKNLLYIKLKNRVFSEIKVYWVVNDGTYR